MEISWTRKHHEHLALAGLLLATALVYLWNIAVNGWANPFYAAAVQAGSQDWKAWFFGSLDTANFITVDKPPASLWLMGLSGRVFGFSSASMLIPQALLAVGTVALLYFTVRRVTGPGAGFVAGAVFALTPAVAVIFRYNNPDALMLFLMVLGAYFLVRALTADAERASAWWCAASGSALGFAFLSKMLEGLIVLPAFGLAYLVAAPAPWKTRLLHLIGASGAMVVSAGWWVAAVALTPAAERPYVGGSTDDSEMNLILGYNGLQRVLGGGKQHSGQPPQLTGEAGNWGGGAMVKGPGIGRLFTGDAASEIDWLLPTTFIALVLGLVLCGRAPRTDRTRSSHILWGGWLLTSFLLFSFMKHNVHSYYVVTLAPAVAATIGTTVWQLWQRYASSAGRLGFASGPSELDRDQLLGRLGYASIVASAGITAWVLLSRLPDWHPEVRWAILGAGVVAVLLLLLPATARPERLRSVAVALALLVSLSGGASYVLATVAAPKTGGSPSAGPNLDPDPDSKRHSPVLQLTLEQVATLRDARTRWAAAALRSPDAAAIELSAGVPAIAVGGFTGNDPKPTLDEFIALVETRQVRYFIDHDPSKDEDEEPGTPKQDGTDQVGPVIEKWVETHAPAPATTDDIRVYDLSKVT